MYSWSRTHFYKYESRVGCPAQTSCETCADSIGCFWNTNNYGSGTCSSVCTASTCKNQKEQCPSTDKCNSQSSCNACTNGSNCVWNSPPNQPNYCSSTCEGVICNWVQTQCYDEEAGCSAISGCAECTNAGCRWNSAADGSGFCFRTCQSNTCHSTRANCKNPGSCRIYVFVFNLLVFFFAFVIISYLFRCVM